MLKACVFVKANAAAKDTRPIIILWSYRVKWWFRSMGEGQQEAAISGSDSDSLCLYHSHTIPFTETETADSDSEWVKKKRRIWRSPLPLLFPILHSAVVALSTKDTNNHISIPNPYIPHCTKKRLQLWYIPYTIQYNMPHANSQYSPITHHQYIIMVQDTRRKTQPPCWVAEPKPT